MGTKQRSEAVLTPDEARAVVKKLQDEHAAAKVAAAKKLTTIDTIMSTVGDRVLDARAAGDNGAEAVAQCELTAARTEAEVAARIVDALGKRIAQAQLDVSSADAHVLREDARRLWAEVAPRLEKTRRLLDELHDHEAVRWIPFPIVEKSGAVANGSWLRTRSGEILTQIVDLERQAAHLEVRAGLVSPSSLLCDVGDVALHLGCAGMIEAAVPIKVSGSTLDAASASLTGERPAAFAALRGELTKKGVQVRG